VSDLEDNGAEEIDRLTERAQSTVTEGGGESCGDNSPLPVSLCKIQRKNASV
jgi:hypothetical protein